MSIQTFHIQRLQRNEETGSIYLKGKNNMKIIKRTAVALATTIFFATVASAADPITVVS